MIAIDLSGKAAIVTGGSRGIGAATAHTLARAGADVLITYARRAREAEKVLKLIQAERRKGIGIQADAAVEADIHRAADMALEAFGRIDIAVVNAGIWKYGALGKMTSRDWDEMLDVNLKGMFLLCNAVVPIMKKQGGGRIIAIASTAGQRGEAFHSHYAASKGGMIAYVKSLAAELGPSRILINAVSPGWVDTDMSASSLKNPRERKQIFNTIPLKKVATAQDIADAVLFLASPLSGHITGSSVNVNGGGVLV